MESDRELLDRYLAQNEEAAFAELVRRHLPHVFGAALRRTDDRGLAEDVSQEVFRDLARKAGRLPDGIVLAAWLHRATRFAARDAIRNNQRRTGRERKASTMETLARQHPEPPWEDIQDWLDEALDTLPPADRDALCVRYLEQRSLADVATSLGTTPEAARKRVSRALDRLRELLESRGVRTTAAALGEAMLAHAAPPLPCGLVAAVAGSAAGIAGGVAPGFFPAFVTSTFMKPTAWVITAALLVGIPLVRQEQAIAQLQSGLPDPGALAGSAPPRVVPAESGGDLNFTVEAERLAEENRLLRGRLLQLETQLKALQGTAAAGGMQLIGERLTIADLSDSGQATPGNAFRSSVAAMRSGDTNRLAQIWTWPPEIHPSLLGLNLRAAGPEHPRGLAADLRSGNIASLVLHRVEPADAGDCWLVYHLELADGVVGPVFRMRMRPLEDRWHIVLGPSGDPDQVPVTP